MRGLTVVLTSADPSKLRAALSIASAAAALGGRARVYFHEDAVSLLGQEPVSPDDVRFASVGLPRLAELLEGAHALGVKLIACQSGLALAGLDAWAIDERIETGGLVSLLQGLDDDRLTTL